MIPKLCSAGCVLLAFVVSTPWSGLAQAREAGVGSMEESANDAYDAGMEAHERGRYSVAAREFQRAYQLAGDVALLWNIAHSLEKAGELQVALERYEEFLTHDDVDKELRGRSAQALIRVGSRLRARSEARTPAELRQVLRRELEEAGARAIASWCSV